MPWLMVNHTRLVRLSAVPMPVFALDVHRGGMPGQPGAELFESLIVPLPALGPEQLFRNRNVNRQSRIRWAQPPGIERHAYDRVHSYSMQMLDLVVSCNSSGNDELFGCCRFQPPHRLEWQASHCAFGINMRVKKCRAKRFKRTDHFERCNVRDFAPAPDRNLAALGVNSENESAFA